MNNLFTANSTRTATSSNSDLGANDFTLRNRPVLLSLKAELVQRLGAEYSEVESRLVRQAVSEADALASLTTVPQLLLPTLAEEKVQALQKWTVRQRAVRQTADFALTA